MDLVKTLGWWFSLLLLNSCQMGYLINNGWEQMSLLAHRQPLTEALHDSKITEEEKSKIRLAIEVRDFAANELGLKVDQIYTSYVKLNRPYVTWVVSASVRNKIQSHLWSFPIVGKMPYKGFFSEAKALEEEKTMLATMDTYVRGVSAYSTLGWFKDPLLSSMMRYKDHDLVDTIIHELVHANLYIKNQADFNERFAVFLGQKGMEMFYHHKEGSLAPTLKLAQDENQDDALFSEFITREIDGMNLWYRSQEGTEIKEADRQQKFSDIKARFRETTLPRMKTKSWSHFLETPLNNARLSVYKTYMKNLDDFQKLYAKVGSDFKKFMQVCQKLQDHPDPEQGLKELLN